MICAALIRLGIAGAAIVGLASGLSGPAAQGIASRVHQDSGQLQVTCPVTRQEPLGSSTVRPPLATRTGEQLEVTVPSVVFISVEPGGLRVTTNTGRPPATSDTFYMIRPGRAGRAIPGVIEMVLGRCR
jgi:hypothetical protein